MLRELGERAKQVTQRLLGAITEIGYGALSEDLVAEHMRGGKDSPLGAENVEVIRPGAQVLPTDIVVIVSRGEARKGPQGMGASLGTLVSLLKDARQRPKLVLFLTEVWDPNLIAGEEVRALRGAMAAGTRIVFLISPPPMTSGPFVTSFTEPLKQRSEMLERPRPAGALGGTPRRRISLEEET